MFFFFWHLRHGSELPNGSRVCTVHRQGSATIRTVVAEPVRHDAACALGEEEVCAREVLGGLPHGRADARGQQLRYPRRRIGRVLQGTVSGTRKDALRGIIMRHDWA